MSDTSDPTLTAAELNDLRVDVLAGIEVSPERYKKLIDNIRRDRINASRPAGKTRKTTSTPIEIPDL